MQLNDRLGRLDINCRVAQAWVELGCHVIPWYYKGEGSRRRKKPGIRGWTQGSAFTSRQQCLDWWAENPQDYPGIVTGSASGVWVLDLDNKPGQNGVESLKAIIEQHGLLPAEALRVKTPSGGWHIYFRWPADVVIRNSQSRLGAGIDVRGQGGYAAAPGAVVQGGEYIVPDTFDEWVDAPTWLIDLAVEAGRDGDTWDGEYSGSVDTVDDLSDVPPGKQDEALFKFLGRLHRQGVPPEQAIAVGAEAVGRFALGDPLDPWTREDVEDKVRSLWARTEYTGISSVAPELAAFAMRIVEAARAVDLPGVELAPDVAAILPDGFRGTDSGNAMRLVALADGRIRYVHAWQKWLVYTEGRWWLDTGDALVREVAKGVARKLLAIAGDSKRVMDSAERGALFKFALKSESASSIGAMVNLARGVPGVLVEHDALDDRPYLLNCLNGTVDLRTGELRAHDPEDLLMMQCPVVYDPGARSELWERCLETWLPDEEVRAFLQRAIGSGATGLPVEALIVNVGNGGNGKSKCFGAVADALGPFAVIPHKSLFTVTKHEAHPTHKASLFRARILLLPETGQGERLNEDSVKGLTGGDVIEARRMREDEWKFKPTHTAFMHTNYRPRIVGDDEGIWRRVKLVNWDVTIPKAERDERLAEKLVEAAPAVLAWIVAGAREWLRVGLQEPAAVLVASESYRDDSDTVQTFIDDTGMMFDGALWVTASDLAQRHALWFATAGIPGRAEYHYQQLSARLKATDGVRQGNTKTRGGRYLEGAGWAENDE